MPRSRVNRRSGLFQALRRLAVALGVVALVGQVLLPLSRPPAAWVAEGLFPPTCSVHSGDLAGDLDDLGQCAQCPLCQLQGGDRTLPAAERPLSIAFVALPIAAPFPPLMQDGPAAAIARPPLPSRGPPAVA